MSSDSDDDYAYTNSVSLLKALTKKNISIDSDIDTTSKDVNFFDISSEVELFKPKPRAVKEDELTDEPITIDSEADEVKDTKNNNDLIELSDDEANVTPVNIISAIDNVLQKGRGSGRRGRGARRGRSKRKCSGMQTRQSKRLKILPTKPNLDDSNVCVVEDTLDVNEINYELTLKVYWKSQNLEKFTIRRFDNLTTIFQHFAKKENVPENRLLFTIKDNIISKNDTPDGLNITAATIIEGGVLSAKTNLVSSTNQDDDKLEFKVQTRDRKHPLLIFIKPEDRMEVLMCKCAGELNVSVKTLKFYFDGDLIKASETAEILGLEGGEIIDCVKI